MNKKSRIVNVYKRIISQYNKSDLCGTHTTSIYQMHKNHSGCPLYAGASGSLTVKYNDDN